eukprot:7022405-Prymnesium_polylepis.1
MSSWRDVPPQAAARHSFVAAAARARSAMGDVSAAEEILQRTLAAEEATEVAAEYARTLERLYLAEISVASSDAAA